MIDCIKVRCSCVDALQDVIRIFNSHHGVGTLDDTVSPDNTERTTTLDTINLELVRDVANRVQRSTGVYMFVVPYESR